MEYKNFFENQKEASIRLQGTIVLYDGQPVEVMAIADHADGILRAYIRPTGMTEDEFQRMPQPDLDAFPYGSSGHSIGKYMDDFIKSNPDCGIIRKHLNSPLFNKFRPFELGMYWGPPYVYYIERQPSRRTEQGLTYNMLMVKNVGLERDSKGFHLTIQSPEMKRCITGEHPTPHRCLQALHDPRLANRAAAFHRHFALVKGPIDTLFLAYKSDVIGQLPHGDFSKVRLGENYRYCKEAVDDLKLFTTIN